MADSLIADSVDRYIELQNPEREMDGLWHPSSVGSPCVRRAVLEKRRVPFSNPPGDETKRIFMLGKIIHKMVQDAVALDERVEWVVPEVEVSGENLTGKADLLIFRNDIQAYELIEIKSIKKAGVGYGLPKSEHIIQAGLYADALRTGGGKMLDGTVIPPLGIGLAALRFVYVVKETMEIVEKQHDIEDAIDYAKDRLDYVQSFEYLERLPMIGQAGKWFLNYCPYKGSGVCCAD